MANVNIIEDNEVNLCKICRQDLAKYCCPKCNISYCSLNCYQSSTHWQCSENFYMDNILKEISLNKNDTKTKISEILKSDRLLLSKSDEEIYENLKLEDTDSDDDSSIIALDERMSGINLEDSEQVWNKLTKDEKQEFIGFLKSEDVTKLIPPWQPWWLMRNKNVIEDSSEEYNKKCPHICEIKDFSEISARRPSKCITYNLINIICAYILTARYFNGEHYDFIREAVNYIVSLSLTLKVSENFMDFETAVKSVEQECINNNSIIMDENTFITMRDDLHQILEGPTNSEKNFFLICALSDIRSLLTGSLKPKGSKEKGTFLKFFNENLASVDLSSTEIKKCRMKIDYYLSFTKDCLSLCGFRI